MYSLAVWYHGDLIILGYDGMVMVKMIGLENFVIVASLILFMASFFQNLILKKINNLNLRFRVGKCRGSAIFNIIYRCLFFHFLSRKNQFELRV